MQLCSFLLTDPQGPVSLTGTIWIIQEIFDSLKPTQTPESWEPSFFPAYIEKMVTASNPHA